MNYEQKYNASLKQAKKELKTCGSMDCDAARLIFRLFPQLRESESEDERIRKALIRHFNEKRNCVGEMWGGFKCDDVIAYLEKQEEQKVDIDKLRKDIYQSGYNDGYQHGEEDAQKEQKPNIELIKRAWYMEGYTDGEFMREPMWNLVTGKGGPKYEENEKYGQPLEQKPAEWSEEDEKMLRTIISDGSRGVELDSKQISWLKSLRPKRVNVSDQTLQLLICYLYGCHDVAKMDWEKEDCRRYISYLEDLDYTLKNRWEPSEEQMEALQRASTNEYLSAKQFDILVSLYEQLKAL